MQFESVKFGSFTVIDLISILNNDICNTDSIVTSGSRQDKRSF